MFYTGGSTACYPGEEGHSLVQVVEAGRTVTVLGSQQPLRNDSLASDGNAALLLNLLAGKDVVWLIPAPAAERPTDPLDLLHPGFMLSLPVLVAAFALLAFWRGRRLGPLVAERLPVVVRASETTEGRAQLYASRRARDRAAAALRSGLIERLRPILGLGPNTAPSTVVAAVSARCTYSPEQVYALLYGRPDGADPFLRDDAELVRARRRTRSTRKRGKAVVSDVHPGPQPSADTARQALIALRSEVAKAVVGQEETITGLVIALLCRGHILLEGVPGVAKTLLVRTVAAALSLDFRRVQFTPDLMPGDVTGSMVYDAQTTKFEFREGPVFTNLLLADEINRTPPKTQAALLEAMEERQVSMDGRTMALPDPFVVAATQNPVEYEGTYPLPEAQLDRFLLKLIGAAAGACPGNRDALPSRRRFRPR